MIQTISNPKMTPEEVSLFRKEHLRMCIKKDYTPEEAAVIKERQTRMRENYNKIIRNNGGKNPLLGY